MPKLTDWPEIEKAIARYQKRIETDQDLLRHLDDAIETQRGRDPTGETASRLADRREGLAADISMRELKIEELRGQQQRIETAVQQLDPREGQIVRRFYHGQERWETIASTMHISRSRFYELLEHARGKIERWLEETGTAGA